MAGTKLSEKISDHQAFVDELLKEYLENGLGVMPKREIDLLIFNLLLNHGELYSQSNHDLSILLQATEAKISNLRYQARLRYPPDENYIQREFLIVLGRAQFELDKAGVENIDKMKIIFAIEDKYLRYAILGRLKAKGMFADTSFNRELVKIQCDSLVNVIEELYGEDIAADFRAGFETLQDPDNELTCSDLLLDFIVNTAKAIFNAAVVSQIQLRLGIPN